MSGPTAPADASSGMDINFSCFRLLLSRFRSKQSYEALTLLYSCPKLYQIASPLAFSKTTTGVSDWYL